MKENRFTIIICMLSCLVLACGVYIALDALDNNEEKQNNTVLTNNTSEGIKTAYECKPLVSDEDSFYWTNNVTLKLFNDNKKEFTLLFKDGDFEVYKDNCSSGKGLEDICKYNDKNDARKYDSYYVYNKKTNKFYNTMAENKWEGSNTDNYYELRDSAGEDASDFDYNYLILNIKDKNIVSGYNVLSCSFHSDIQFNTCKKSDTIIAYNENASAYADVTKYGLVSLKDDSEILKLVYNHISEDDNGNFLVEKDNKMGLYSSTGKELLKLEYDYIGYNEYFGYITIVGEDLKVYDNNLKLRNVDEKSLSETFTTILNAHNECVQSKIDTEKVNYLSLSNPDSYLWSAGSLITMQDINKPYYDNFVDEESDSYRFKYTGKKYTGEKLIIYSIRGGCSGKPVMYVIDGNKAHKIDTKEISIKKDSEGNFAAFCF